MSFALFKNVIDKLLVYKAYISNMYISKLDLALNNLQGLICHKNQPKNELLERLILLNFWLLGMM